MINHDIRPIPIPKPEYERSYKNGMLGGQICLQEKGFRVEEISLFIEVLSRVQREARSLGNSAQGGGAPYVSKAQNVPYCPSACQAWLERINMQMAILQRLTTSSRGPEVAGPAMCHYSISGPPLHSRNYFSFSMIFFLTSPVRTFRVISETESRGPMMLHHFAQLSSRIVILSNWNVRLA